MPKERKKDAKVAIVTGATGGLGRIVAAELSRRGYAVVGCARKAGPERAPGYELVSVDVTNEGAVSGFVKDVFRRLGRIDVVVNSAGFVNRQTRLEETRSADMKTCFRTNAYAPFYLMRAVAPIMRKQRHGVVVNVSSKSGYVPVPGLSAYSASKAALVALTEAFAKEVAGAGIFCASVSPEGMNTEMRASLFGRKEARTRQSARRVADVVVEVATSRKVLGRAVAQGTELIVLKHRVYSRGMRPPLVDLGPKGPDIREVRPARDAATAGGG